MFEYRWEYSPLAKLGNFIWAHSIDPLLRLCAPESLDLLRRLRGVIQKTITAALFLIIISFFFPPARLLSSAGLLFDIAGALRLFLYEEILDALSGFKENKYGNLPSVAMRELVMPEASGPYDSESHYMSLFFYKRRGVLYLFLGFTLQLIATWVS
jgi:hypothetical protein